MYKPRDILLPYQRDWVQDQARFKIGLMARQTGKSMCTAEEAVNDAHQRKTTWVCLSAGERQALEWMKKAQDWARAYDLAISDYREVNESSRSESLLKSAEIILPNDSRIIAIPANPNTARGYSANLILDEFAFHENPGEIWKAIYPSISNPLKGTYKLRIVSTANGKNNKFYDLWTKNKNYSKHFVDIYTAVKRGLPLDIEELKSGLDDADAWAQEYECLFIDSAGILLPYELIATCESDDAHTELDEELFHIRDAEFYVGIDVGRKHDKTVIYVMRRFATSGGSALITQGYIELDKTKFKAQFNRIDSILKHPSVKKCCIDSTGIGAQLAEDLHDKYRHKVEQCQFTNALKNELFGDLKTAFENRELLIPADKRLREDLHSIQKIVSQSGSIRYSAPRNEDGHADIATAKALCLRASKAPTCTFAGATLSNHDAETFGQRLLRRAKQFNSRKGKGVLC
jgi:phage FluMu gp28-like protein